MERPGQVTEGSDLDALLQTRSAAKATELAARLRHLLRTSRSALDRAGQLLLDATTPADVRTLLALVLGSLPTDEAQAFLSRALDAASDSAWIRTLLIALGSTKFEGEDDDVFDDSGRPWVIEISGLSITVKARLGTEYIRGQILRYLNPGSPPEVRDAAIRALRHSMEFPDVRRDFRTALTSERNEELQGNLGQGLAEWAREQAVDSPDRQAILASVLEQGRRPETAALRFSTEASLKVMPMDEREVQAIAELLQSPDFDQRRWALSVLGFKAEAKDFAERERLLPVFGRILAVDPDAKAREYAAGALGSMADRPDARAMLLQALGDPAWHVRAGAASALGRSTSDPRVADALIRIAQSDANENVRKTAEKILKAAGPR